MNEIWANRLVAGTKTWEDVPASRRAGVLAVLQERADGGAVSQEELDAIVNGGTRE